MKKRDKNGEIYEGNPAFFQFRKHNFKMIRKLNLENPTALNLFLFLVDNMLEGSQSLIVSQIALCEYLEISRMTLHRATKTLIEKKFIDVFKSGTSNVYCVNADIVWTKRAEELYHAKFNTSVYLTSTEQDENTRTKIIKAFEKRIEIEKADCV